MKTIHDEDFLQFIGKQESQWLAKPTDFTDSVLERFSSTTDGTLGDLLPWSKTHGKVGLRPGEVSVFAGINGHGKSQIVGMIMGFMLPATSVLIASLEMKPAATIQRMIRQCCGRSDPSKDYIENWLRWTDYRLWIYDQLDTVESDRILGMVHYAAAELGIQHIVIDSLMKCNLPGGDKQNAAQKSFVDRLCWAAKSRNVHIHLVHHMRKGERETKIPDKFDVKGAGEIVDLADNLFIVHRNKAKERRRESGEDVDQYEPDAVVDVAKQRHGEWEGRINLYFHKDSQQYTPNPDHGAMPWGVDVTDMGMRNKNE